MTATVSSAADPGRAIAAVARDVRAFLDTWHRPGLGTITGATDPRPSPVDRRVAFTGSRLDTVVGPAVSRVVVLDEDGSLTDVSDRDGSTRLPRWSPDGSLLAFTSDHLLRGVHRVVWVSADLGGDPVDGPALPGTVESLCWSPSGRLLLAVVAGFGAENAGAMASGRVPLPPDSRSVAPDPQVRSFPGHAPESEWRRAWVVDTQTGAATCIAPDGPCVWEASWCNDGTIVAVVSDGPEEDDWYGARVSTLDVASGVETILVRSDRQLGLPVGWPDGRIACVEAPCSDRTLVAGRVVLADPGGDARRLQLALDATHLLALPDDRLLISGLVGMDSVVAGLDLQDTSDLTVLWRSADAVGPRQPEAWPTSDGAVVVALDSWERPATIVEIALDGGEIVRWSGAHDGTAAVRATLGPLEHVTWTAPDGWAIDGLLARPAGDGPHPLLLYPHGGPVASWRRRFLGGYTMIPIFVARGWAVLMPNPRGSSGYGWDFADAVHGDMGGHDTNDLLSGIDHLVATGVADAGRLAVTGGSYAGYMTCWLVTQTDRFRAAAASAPVTNWISQHFQSNIPEWGRRFLPDTDRFPTGGYVDRSPVFAASAVTTPTWLSAGAHDRCCPPTQCVEFHEALRACGVPTDLVIYPDDAHNIPTGDRQVDHVARVVEWIERWCL